MAHSHLPDEAIRAIHNVGRIIIRPATAISAITATTTKEPAMSKTIEHIHWPDAPDMWMPYAPAIKVKGGTTVYLAGVTAAPVYHHHPHRTEEFEFDAVRHGRPGARGA